jgi:hypothetical protein
MIHDDLFVFIVHLLSGSGVKRAKGAIFRTLVHRPSFFKNPREVPAGFCLTDAVVPSPQGDGDASAGPDRRAFGERACTAPENCPFRGMIDPERRLIK